MVTLKKRPRTLETPVNPKQSNPHEHQQSTRSETVSNYEQCREQRIKENMERMQKLGLFDLSSKLKTEFSSPKRSPRRSYSQRTPQASPLDPNLPQRRSSRLVNGTPISYAEEPMPKRERGKGRSHSAPYIGEGSRPEVYTEEHDKLLGSTEMPWTLFVDGCGPDGKRIYDPVRGKTCHQCRQKTMGHRTHCKECNLVQGQFCGDCLYMRYGEHVLEANKNPDWICPPCRGICNCSLCRQARGWPATGQLYKKVLNLGFKSVAHYLIQTRRAETKSDEVGTDAPVTKSDDVGADDPVTVKRSLPFVQAEEEVDHKESVSSDDEQHECPKHIDKRANGLKGKKKRSVNSHSAHGVGDVSSVDEAKVDSIGKRPRQRQNKSLHSSDNLLGSPVHGIIDNKSDKEDQSLNVDSAHGGDHSAEEEVDHKESVSSDDEQHECPKHIDKRANGLKGKKKRSVNSHSAHGVGDVSSVDEAKVDSIGKRPRQRQNKSLHSSDNLLGSPVHGIIDNKSDKEDQSLNVDSAHGGDHSAGSASVGSPDSIAKRLRQRRNKSGEHRGNSEDGLKEETREAVNEHLAGKVSPGSQTRGSGKSFTGNEPNPDSISGRLRQRRNRM